MRRWLKSFWHISLITLVGAFLRFYRLQASLQFLGDQGRDALVLREILVNHNLPFIGPVTSVGGFYLGPLYYYLMAPFLWLFNFNPAGPAYATAFIGVITIPFLYLVAKKMFDQKTALWASLLYAVGSIPVIETRGAWNPNPMPLAALGVVYGFYRAQTDKDRRWLWLSALSLGAALQFHYMIVFLGPFLLWQLIKIGKQKKLRQGLIAWFLLVVLTMGPLILFELKNHFLNLHGLIAYLTQNDYEQFNWWQIVKNLRGRSEEAIGMLLGFGRTTTLVRTNVTRILLLGFGYLWWKRGSRGLKTVLGWLLLTIGSIAFFRGSIPPYYLAFIFPAVFILTARLLAEAKGIWLAAVAVFLAYFGWFNYQNLYPMLTGRGNLISVQATSRLIVDDVNANHYQNFNLTLLDDTRDYRASAFRYFVKVDGGNPLGIDAYPQTKVLYIVSPFKQTDVLSVPIWEIKSVKPAKLEATWEFANRENVYKIIKL